MYFLIFPPSQDSLVSVSELLLQTYHFIFCSFVWKTFMFPSMNLISSQKQVWQASRGQQRALTEQYDVTPQASRTRPRKDGGSLTVPAGTKCF